MNYKTIFIVMSVFLVLVISQPVVAGVLQGRVLCKNNKPARNEVITVVGKINTRTNEKGYYGINLKPGKYVFKIRNQYFNVIMYSYDSPRDFYIRCR